MAYQILTDVCDACGACESECPNRAISHVKKEYKIDPNKCTQCQDVYDSPMCAQLCNPGACVPA